MDETAILTEEVSKNLVKLCTNEKISSILDSTAHEAIVRRHQTEIPPKVHFLFDTIHKELQINRNILLEFTDFWRLYEQLKNKNVYTYPSFTFDDDYFDRVKDLLNCRSKEKILVEEWITKNVWIEEKIKIKIEKLNKHLKDYQPWLKTYQTRINEQERLMKENGREVIQWDICWLDCSKLKPGKYVVKFLCDGQERLSSVSKEVNGVSWNEQFQLSLNERRQVLTVQWYLSERGERWIGNTQINWEELDAEQKSVEDIYKWDHNSNAEWRWKLQYIYNPWQYFRTCERDVQQKIVMANTCLSTLNQFIPCCDLPFGVVLSGKVALLFDQMNQSIFMKVDDLDKFEPVIINNIITPPRAVNLPMNKEEEIIQQVGDMMKWGRITVISVVLVFTLSLLNLTVKNDWMNFVTISGVLAYYLLGNKFDSFGLRQLMILLGVTEGFDLLWLVTSFQSYAVGKNEIGNDSSWRVVSYIWTLINWFVKAWIILAMRAFPSKC